MNYDEAMDYLRSLTKFGINLGLGRIEELLRRLGDPHRMSWGYLANNAQRFLRVAWWVALFPGVAIALAVLGLNLLGDALNDLLDPRARRPT